MIGYGIPAQEPGWLGARAKYQWLGDRREREGGERRFGATASELNFNNGKRAHGCRGTGDYATIRMKNMFKQNPVRLWLAQSVECWGIHAVLSGQMAG